MDSGYITRFIEKNNLVKIKSIDECLFSQGKLQIGFFIYLVIELEEYYDIIKPIIYKKLL